MALTDETTKRFRDAQDRFEKARHRLSDANSEYIDAERKLADASNAWEREYFSDAKSNGHKSRFDGLLTRAAKPVK